VSEIYVKFRFGLQSRLLNSF